MYRIKENTNKVKTTYHTALVCSFHLCFKLDLLFFGEILIRGKTRKHCLFWVTRLHLNLSFEEVSVLSGCWSGFCTQDIFFDCIWFEQMGLVFHLHTEMKD